MNDEEEEEESTNEIIPKISINGYTQRGENEGDVLLSIRGDLRPDDPSAFAVQQALLRRGNGEINVKLHSLASCLILKSTV